MITRFWFTKRGLLRRAIASATAALVTVGTFQASAQEAPVYLTGDDSQQPVGKQVSINVGHSAALRTEWKLKTVSVANETIADILALETNELLIVGKAVGKTDLILWGENGEVWATTIVVDVDIEQLNADLKDLFPRSTVQMYRSQDVYFAKGVFETADQARQLNDFLATAEIKYVDMTSVAGLQQVRQLFAIKRLPQGPVRAFDDPVLLGTMRLNPLMTQMVFIQHSTELP